MVLFTVIVQAMIDARDAIAVFTTQEKANAFINTDDMRGAIVQPCAVDGEYTSPNRTVFAAHKYMRESDVHSFIGLFSDYEKAKRAAGEKCQVLELTPL
jgi:hypothetical protein